MLQVQSWTNPRPEVSISSIDVVSPGKNESALMLFDITAE